VNPALPASRPLANSLSRLTIVAMNESPTLRAPRVLTRIQRPVRLFQLLLVVPAFALIWLPGGPFTAAVILFGVLALGAEGILTLRLRGLRKRLVSWKYRACPDCGAYLASVRGRQPCPDCGANFDWTDLERIWRGPEGLSG